MQLANGLSRFRSDLVLEGQCAHDPAVCDDVEDGSPLPGPRVGLPERLEGEVCEETGAADGD
jgi:hypothetical protein